jgi:hypothetical protein
MDPDSAAVGGKRRRGDDENSTSSEAGDQTKKTHTAIVASSAKTSIIVAPEPTPEVAEGGRTSSLEAPILLLTGLSLKCQSCGAAQE